MTKSDAEVMQEIDDAVVLIQHACAEKAIEHEGVMIIAQEDYFQILLNRTAVLLGGAQFLMSIDSMKGASTRIRESSGLVVYDAIKTGGRGRVHVTLESAFQGARAGIGLAIRSRIGHPKVKQIMALALPTNETETMAEPEVVATKNADEMQDLRAIIRQEVLTELAAMKEALFRAFTIGAQASSSGL